MQSSNPFNHYPPAETVDAVLGRSYDVVKAVYCQLDALVTLTIQIPEIRDQFPVLTEIYNIRDQIKNIGNNLDEILKAPEYIEAIKTNTETSKKELTETKNSLTTELVETKDKLDKEFSAELLEKKNEIITEANTAMYSFRYYSLKLIPFTSGQIEYLQPKANVKPHDHVIDLNGDVFEILAISDGTFTISGIVTSIKGEKGDKGNIGPRGQDGLPGLQGPQGPQGIPGAKGEQGAGIKIYGTYQTIEDLQEAHPTGIPGEAYIVRESVWFWDNVSLTWKDSGILQGPEGQIGPQGLQGPQGLTGPRGERGLQGLQGEPGPSILETIMDPDPTNNFNKYYA